MGHSRSRSPKRRRSHSRDRDRDKDRDRRRQRSRSRSRSRNRDRDRNRKRSAKNEDKYSRRSSRSRSPKSKTSRKANKLPVVERPIISEKSLEGKDPDEQEIMKLMGFCGFDSSKGKQIVNNNAGEVHVILKRKYRQYMNRKGGFNRPLDFVA